MKKLSLDLDDLRVESFETDRVPEPRGTVRGLAATPAACCTWSCGGTCGAAPDSTWNKPAPPTVYCCV